MEVRAKGQKILIKRGDSQKIIEKEDGVLLSDNLQKVGTLGVVEGVGEGVTVDLENGDIVIIDKSAGMQLFSYKSEDELRLVDQSKVYGVLNLSADEFSLEKILT